ncbi:ABC transporter permease [Glutamicibacter sp. NPDC087344]|uniref:ABC transporter permease n=1 Tax=Glutamicibacter sp. NPDC087344 TaxID=3363994 RepID=UPI00380C9870
MSTPTAPWLIVALREVETKVKDKAFVISTVVTLLLIVGAVAFTGFMGNKTSTFSVVATDSLSYQVLAEAQNQRPDNVSLTISQETADQAGDRLSSQEVDATLVSSANQRELTLTGYDEVDPELRQLISTSMTTVLTRNVLSAHGVDPAALPSETDLKTAQLQGDAEKTSMVQAMALIFSFLFYMAALIFGMPIANSVIEEKQNRVVEILASTVRLRQLLAGKIIGNVILAMAQLLLFLGVGLLAAYLAPGQIPFLGVVSTVAGWFIVFFLGGFLLLAGIWAALGALATRTEDLQQSSGPIIGALVAVMFIGIYAKGSLLVIASYIPIVSSVAMPIRMLSGDVPLWEALLSLTVLLVVCWAVLLFSERIYRRAVMHTGGALTLRKAIKLEV